VTELVRTVRSGSVGLDLVLGGGPRLLRRISGSGSESATLLLRGGPGTGKSVLAADTALRMARALGGDVLYVCVEILPREVLSQRMGFDGFDPAKVIDLAQPEARKASGDGPTLVVGMTEMKTSEDDEVPDVGAMILDLVRISVERGCDPRVVVVDSLSDGYGLGAGVPRPTVDGVCKMAVEQGWVLILVEEAVDERPSPWSFAVDTVLSLEVTPAGRREVRVIKHRFGSCQPGPHRLLVEREGVRVLPCFAAYRNAVRDLALPPPATNRSLRVRSPELAQEPDWTRFNVPDGEGRFVAVGPLHQATLPELTKFAATIGATAQDGSAHPGARVTLELSESHENPIEWEGAGFHVGTLHQMIDGEEWLEAAVSLLVANEAPVARVRIGPTDLLWPYEQHDTIRKAISLLAAILARRGLVVVVYGGDVHRTILRAATISDSWFVTKVADPPAGRLKVKRIGDRGESEFEALVT
jgi:KaiC/GvpD/RAD55 family RecA-like ATPase